MAITLEAIRAAGGVVHSDGNIFFRDISMLQGLAGAAPAAVAPRGDYPQLPEGVMCIEQVGGEVIGRPTDYGFKHGRGIVHGAELFTSEQMRAHVDADRAARADRPAAVAGPADDLAELAMLNKLIELGAKASYAHAKSNSDDGPAGTAAYVQWQELRAEMGELIRAQAAPALEAPAAPVPELPGPDLWRDASGLRGYTKDPGQGPWYTADTVRALLAAAPQAPNCTRCSGSGEDPEGYLTHGRGPDDHTVDGPCRECDGTGTAPQAPRLGEDALHLLRRLLSNQHTLTGPEFRSELEKIVAEESARHAAAPQAPAAPSAGMTPRDRETQDQIASVMLQHGTAEQQSQALAYASGAAPTAPVVWRAREEFVAWAEVAYRHEDEFSKRDFEICLKAWRFGGASALLAAQAAPAAPAVDALAPVQALLDVHAELLDANPYAYFELAYTRQTGWMAWITDKPMYGAQLINPDRKVLARGHGETAAAACAAAAQAKEGGEAC